MADFATTPNMDSPGRFQRGLKRRHISLIALGGIIGSSYFLGTGYVLHQIGPSIFLAYILGGFITFLTMACLGELVVSSPEEGSFIGYINRYISPTLACGVGWSYWISWVVYIPSECLAAGILMHSYVPHITIYSWAVFFGILITSINLIGVKLFGEMEFWLSITKIFLLVSFSLLAIFIYFGWMGDRGPLGATYLLDQGGLFPKGYLVFFINMVVLLSNFQGSEIIGLSASESVNPRRSLIESIQKIAIRICGFYLLPTLLLALIFPWKEAGLSGSVFAAALDRYGLTPVAHLFNIFIISGAISCANSGLYATTRSLRALAIRGLAPLAFQTVNARGVPANASYFTIGAMWTLLAGTYFFSAHSLYANLLALSGFTGTFCWIFICFAQLRFRRTIAHPSTLKYRIPWFPYLTHLSIWLQVLCLCVVALSHHLRSSFYLGVPSLLLPMAMYAFSRRGK